MKLVYNPLMESDMYHFVNDDNFNHTSLQNIKLVCGKRSNVRVSFMDIDSIITDKRFCKKCLEIYKKGCEYEAKKV